MRYCPNRWQLLDTLGVLDNWAIDKPRTTLATARAVSRVIKEPAIKWTAGPSYDLSDGDFTVSGTYDPAADEIEENIFIECTISIGGNITRWTEHTWSQFKRQTADVICHEMIHAYQHRARNFSCIDILPVKDTTDELEKERVYLGDPDEVECYAHNIAAELLDYYGHIRFAKKYDWQHLITFQPPNCPSIHLWAYGRAWGHDKKFMSKLIKKTYEYLDEIYVQYLEYMDDN